MAQATQLLVVPHTHWDREWYQTFQQFRMRLVRAVDHVLDLLERDPSFSYFMLDGQTIVLEDYLAIRPEHAARLRALTRAGRLLIGPWYVQPDEFLVGGESLITNLRIGRQMAAEYGGAMPVGYVPDTFGHIAQLPQLLRGFGLDNVVFWRGVPPEVARSEFHWQAPDGSEVLAIWLCHETGYSNAAILPLDADALVARASLIAAALGPRATTDVLLLMNGSDHLEPQDGLPEALDAANATLAAQGQHLFIGTLPQYIAVAREGRQPLETYRGELRSSFHAHVLPGVYSTRLWLKQRNAACEALLARWAEPATAWAWALGAPHPTALLETAWRFLLHNHPHDSICGCGIDQVHREMLPRFDQSEQIAEELTDQALHALVAHVETTGPERGTPLVVFNASGGTRTDFARCVAHAPAADVELVDSAGRPVLAETSCARGTELLRQEVDKQLVVSLLDIANDGRALNYIISDVRVADAPDEPGVATITVTVCEEGEPDADLIRRAKDEVRAMAERDDITTFRAVAYEAPRTEVRFVARDVPAFGGRVFYLRPRVAAPGGAPDAGSDEAVRVEPMALENAYVRVEVDAHDGTLTLRDKRRGVVYRGQNAISDGGDVGDLYTYCPPASDWEIRAPSQPPRVTCAEAGPARGMLRVTRIYRLPAGCTPERDARSGETVECRVISEVALCAEGRRVEIRTTIENGARDHRLRVHFPAPFAATEAEAEGVFEIARRPARQPLPASGGWEGWAEVPVNTHPQKRFVSVAGEGRGLAVLNRGLTEYELLPGDDEASCALALTLLRGVEWLSRNDLATRRGHAGPMLHTPEAQGLGTHTYDYALLPYSGTWYAEEGLVLREAEAFEAPLRACLTTRHAGALPSAWHLVSVAPAAVALSLVKRAASGEGLVVRVYNPRTEPVAAEVALGVAVSEALAVDLAEEPLTGPRAPAQSVTDSRARFMLRPGEIRTLLFRLT